MYALLLFVLFVYGTSLVGGREDVLQFAYRIWCQCNVCPFMPGGVVQQKQKMEEGKHQARGSIKDGRRDASVAQQQGTNVLSWWGHPSCELKCREFVSVLGCQFHGGELEAPREFARSLVSKKTSLIFPMSTSTTRYSHFVFVANV
jgi:hypothetical protein